MLYLTLYYEVLVSIVCNTVLTTCQVWKWQTRRHAIININRSIKNNREIQDPNQEIKRERKKKKRKKKRPRRRTSEKKRV